MKMHRRNFLRTSSRAAASLVTAAVLPASIVRAGTSRDVMLRRTVMAMGTTVTVTAYGESRAHVMESVSEAFGELFRLDRLLSVFKAESEISRLNSADAEEPVQLSDVTMEVLSASGRFTELTEGTFDVTVGGLLNLCGFHDDQRPVPEVPESILNSAREGIGWKHIRLGADGTARRLHHMTKIDLGGIGAGFAVDRMATILRKRGITSALIDHSGDVLAIGAPPETEGWRVVIADPLDETRYVAVLTLCDRALSTSTNTRTTRSVGSRIVGHLMDPETGENPQRVESVSVLAPTSVEADALSTALYVDADSKGRWRNGEREAIVIRPDGRERIIDRIR